MIPSPLYMDALHFTASRWRAGSPADFFVIPCREVSLVGAGDILRNHAVGYCKGEHLMCRPKVNHWGVMFFKEGRHFWFHLRDKEMRSIFT